MATIAEIAATDMLRDERVAKRLAGVPAAVVEDVVRIAVEHLADHLRVRTDPGVEYDLACEDWQRCEACPAIVAIDAGDTVHGPDGIVFCAECHARHASDDEETGPF